MRDGDAIRTEARTWVWIASAAERRAAAARFGAVRRWWSWWAQVARDNAEDMGHLAEDVGRDAGATR
jgi:hypothetical protein